MVAFLVGAFLLYAVFALKIPHISFLTVIAAFFIYACLIMLLPVMALIFGIGGVIGYGMAGNYLLAAASLAATAAFYAAWWGVWYMLYGRKQ